jgi:hypothetical protein
VLSQNHFPEPNRHPLSFLHPILTCRITHWALLEMLLPQYTCNCQVWVLSKCVEKYPLMWTWNSFCLHLTKLIAVECLQSWWAKDMEAVNGE